MAPRINHVKHSCKNWKPAEPHKRLLGMLTFGSLNEEEEEEDDDDDEEEGKGDDDDDEEDVEEEGGGGGGQGGGGAFAPVGEVVDLFSPPLLL